MSSRKNKRKTSEHGMDGEAKFMMFAFIIAFLFGMAKVGPDLYEAYDDNQITTITLGNEDYKNLAMPEHDLSRYQIDSWVYTSELRFGENIKVKGYVNKVPISINQRVTREECRIREVEITDKGIEYGLKTGDINKGLINAQDVEQCLVRFFAMLSKVSEKTAIKIAQDRKDMIEKEINRSSFAKSE